MELKILLLNFVLYFLCCTVSCTEQCSSELPQDPNSLCCGIDVTTKNRIVGGEPASLRQYPWLGLVEFTYSTGDTYFLCGAFLISSRYVLTAAHCVSGITLDDGRKPTAIRLGDYDKTNPGEDCVNLPAGRDCTTAISVPIEKITVHENFFRSSTNLINDIALIRLKKLVPYTDHIRPICLPSSDVTAEHSNLKLHAAGWGTMNQIKKSPNRYDDIESNVKRHVVLPYVSYEKCLQYWPRLIKSQVCAGVKGKNHCKGDSGGPLMYNREGVYEAVGIASFVAYGEPCAARPGVHTKVFQFKTWIMKNIWSSEIKSMETRIEKDEAKDIKTNITENTKPNEDGANKTNKMGGYKPNRSENIIPIKVVANETNEVGDNITNKKKDTKENKEENIKTHRARNIKMNEARDVEKYETEVGTRNSSAAGPPLGLNFISLQGSYIVFMRKFFWAS